MFRLIIILIRLITRGGVSATTSSKTEEGYQNVGFHKYGKDVFDEHYHVKYYKWPIGDMPTDIEYYHANIGHITLMKRQQESMFEIFETNILSDKELAFNVKLSYKDFVMTGISSRKEIVVTQSEFFVLFINDELNQLEVLSTMYEDLKDKMTKSDFGEYLIKYLIKQKETAGTADRLINVKTYEV